MNFSDLHFTYEAGNSRAIQMRISDNLFEFLVCGSLRPQTCSVVLFGNNTSEDFFIEIDCSSTRNNTGSIFQWELIGILLDRQES